MIRYQWRPMTPADLACVMDIAAQVHLGYFEAEEVFAERLRLFPQGCRIAIRQDDGEQVIGYAFMHPTRHGSPPALNQLLHCLETQADCLHLHDVALLPSARGSGLGRSLVGELRQICRGADLPRAALVAVHDSGDYWGAAGFADDPQALRLGQGALGSYGTDARYMSMIVK